MTANNPSDIIDLRKVFRKIWNRKKLFVKTLSFTFFIACLYILPLPRYYNCNITLAPEMENSASGGSLGSLASSFGINLNSAGSTDAIPPVLYPDLMEASDFMVSLFPIKVVSEDGLISTDYYTYIKKHQKTNLWLRPFKWIKKTIASLFTKNEATSSNGHKVDPFKLSKEQQDVVSTMKNHISCDVDKKTTIVAKELAEYTNVHQDFYFSQSPDSIFVHTSNGGALISHIKRSARYMRFIPSEALTNFFASFAHSLTHIEE